MRKIMIACLAIGFVLVMTACSSKEEDEVLDFHNDMVDDLYPLYEEFDQVAMEVSIFQTEEEVYEAFDTQLVPIVEQMEEFFASYDIETEVAQEYYDLRKEANKYLVDYVYMGTDLVKEYLDGTISEDEFVERDIELTSYLNNHVEVSEEADQRWEEIFDEYGFVQLN